MRNTFKFIAMLRIAGIIAIVAIIGLGFAACGDDTGGNGSGGSGGGTGGSGGGGCDGSCLAIGATGEGGGIIIYHNHAGFTVTGAGSFTAYYLEAAPDDQGTSQAWASSGYFSTNIPGTGTVIGTGKANTAAILAVDANAPAAKACADYRGGDKDDWFLPSKDELNEMYEARIHLGISSGWFWSSSQSKDTAKIQGFSDGSQVNGDKYNNEYGVRAVRAF